MSGLIRLIYVSRASFEPATESIGVEPTVARILLQSRHNNPQQEIGGVLYYGDGCFFQCLEGQTDVVNGLVSRIMQDSRHSDVQILKVVPVKERLFKNWSMKYIPVEKDVNGLLKRHGLQSFDPYRFGDDVIDELVELFARISHPGSRPDQDYRDSPRPPPTLWRRMLSFVGVRR